MHLHVSAPGILRILSVQRSPQDLSVDLLGLLLRQLGDLGRIVGIGKEKLGVEFGLEPGPVHVRALRDQVVEHDQEAPVERVKILAARGAARQPGLHDLSGRGLPDNRRIELAGAEIRGDDLDVLVEVGLRLDARLLERQPRKAIRT